MMNTGLIRMKNESRAR